jgi:hypothetical protein
MGQKQKLFEDTANVLEWMNDENFREFVLGLTEHRPVLVRRLQRELARAEKKLLTSRRTQCIVNAHTEGDRDV